MKKLILAGVIGVVTFIAFLCASYAYLYHYDKNAVMMFKRDFAKNIKLGMSKAEAIAVIGKEPGNYCDRETMLTNPPLFLIGQQSIRNDVSELVWIDEKATIRLQFDKSGQLVSGAATTNSTSNYIDFLRFVFHFQNSSYDPSF